MSESPVSRILWMAAAALLIAGVVMTASNLGKMEDITVRFKKKNGELKVLNNLAADLARYEVAKQKMEKVAGKHPLPLSGVLDAVLPGGKAEERDSRKELVAGWSLRQKEISLNDVPVGNVMEFIRRAESQAMPWCLTKFVVRSATKAAGTGQVVLQMEAVDKTE